MIKVKYTKEVPRDYTGLVQFSSEGYFFLFVDGVGDTWSADDTVLSWAHCVKGGSWHHTYNLNRWWHKYKDHPIAGKYLAAYILGSND